MLGPYRDADQVFGDAAVGFFAVGELLVGRSPGVDCEGFGIADAGGRGMLVAVRTVWKKLMGEVR